MKWITVICFLLACNAATAQKGIKAKQLIKNVAFFSSDVLEGRWPGSEGDLQTRSRIKSEFSKARIQPMYPGFEQSFTTIVTLGAPQKNNYLFSPADTQYKITRDFSILPFSGNGLVNAAVIYSNNNENTLQSLAASPGKWVVLWRKKAMAPATDSLSDYALVKKAITNGAAAVLLVSPDSVDKNDVLVRLRPRKDVAVTVPVIQLKRACWNRIKTALEKNNSGSVAGMSTTAFEASVQVQPEKVAVANLVGLIEGNDPILKNEYIVIGAHYDHLGHGGFGTGSLKPDTTAIHNGADDNASGTTALIAIARELSRTKHNLKRSVIVIAFTAEEEGLLGSQYFVDHMPVPDGTVKVMLNMDMVGRLNKEGNLYMGGAGTFNGGVELMKSLKENSGLDPAIHAGGVGGSDHVSFYRKKIAAIGFHTGGHPQYHTPEDDAAFINAAGMQKVARYIYRAMVAIANWPEPIRFVMQD